MIQPILLRDKQVAEFLSISRPTVWRRLKAGKLPAPIQWEGVTVWRRSDLEAFVEALAD